MSERLAAAEATLARLGLDPGALGAGEVDATAVAPLLAGAGGAALADALGEVATPAVAALLVALEPEVPDRAVRKALRRSLYRLRQRGVPVPAPKTESAAPRTIEPDAEGFVTAVDGRGDRLIWIARSLAAGGVFLVAAQLNEPAGLREVHSAELSRKSLRAARQQLERESGARLVAADWRTLDAILVEAHTRAGSTERDRDYLRLRPRLTSEAAIEPAEPVSNRAPAVTVDRADVLVAGSEALLREPELASWWPAPEALAPFVDEINAARDSPIVLSPAAQQDRVREAIGRAARILVPPAVFARRLAASAYVLAETGRVAAARQALAVARLLAERPEGAAGIPFVAAYVERALGTLLAERAEHQKEERRGALVVTPGEYLKDRASARPPRTRE